MNKTVIWIIAGGLILFFGARLLSNISQKAPEEGATTQSFINLAKTGEALNLVKTNEFRELVKTPEFKQFIKNLTQAQIYAITNTLSK